MYDKPQATHTLGLNVDGTSLTGVALVYSRGKPRLEKAIALKVEPDSENPNHVKPLYTTEQQNELATLAESHLTVTGLETGHVLLRPLELKIKKEKDIDSILTFQAEPILPYPTENAILDKTILVQDNTGSKITLFSARKDHMVAHTEFWNTLGIEPEMVTAAPHALCLFAKEFAAPCEVAYLLYIGNEHSFCVLAENGKPVAAQTIPAGLAFSPDTLKIGINRTVFALAKQVKGKEIPYIMVSGPGSLDAEFGISLAKTLNKTLLEVPNAPAFGMNSDQLLLFALPIGLALSALPGTKQQINFRQGEYSYPSPWKRLKQPLSLYLALCLILAVCLNVYGRAYIGHQEAQIRQQYLDLLAGMNRAYPDFEKDYMTKTKTTPRDLAPGEVLAVAELTPEQIKNRLQYLEKEVQAIPQIFPLQPNVPLVSDVLAWISTHPSFTKKNESKEGLTSGEEGEEELSSTLQIENFSYTMIKRPEPTKKQEKYQVKVELEFISPMPKMAREFHDALIAPNDIVDPKAEIKWNSNRDHYRTSFYLKDKTAYPSP